MLPLFYTGATSIFLLLKKKKNLSICCIFIPMQLLKSGKHTAVSSDTLTSTATPRFLEEMLSFMSPSKQR